MDLEEFYQPRWACVGSVRRPRFVRQLYKTIPCRHPRNCEWGVHCNFAHTIEELQVRHVSGVHKSLRCVNGRRCKFEENCVWLHPHEKEVPWCDACGVSLLVSSNGSRVLAKLYRPKSVLFDRALFDALPCVVNAQEALRAPLAHVSGHFAPPAIPMHEPRDKKCETGETSKTKAERPSAIAATAIAPSAMESSAIDHRTTTMAIATTATSAAAPTHPTRVTAANPSTQANQATRATPTPAEQEAPATPDIRHTQRVAQTRKILRKTPAQRKTEQTPHSRSQEEPSKAPEKFPSTLSDEVSLVQKQESRQRLPRARGRARMEGAAPFALCAQSEAGYWTSFEYLSTEEGPVVAVRTFFPLSQLSRNNSEQTEGEYEQELGSPHDSIQGPELPCDEYAAQYNNVLYSQPQYSLQYNAPQYNAPQYNAPDHGAFVCNFGEPFYDPCDPYYDPYYDPYDPYASYYEPPNAALSCQPTPFAL
jgi:hypothetical protein